MTRTAISTGSIAGARGGGAHGAAKAAPHTWTGDLWRCRPGAHRVGTVT